MVFLCLFRTLFPLSFAFLFVLRIRPSIAFFFSSGGCSCPACPPPPCAVCCCGANGNGGGCGCGGGGGGGCANGGFAGANCGAIGGYNNGGGGNDGGCTIQIVGCGSIGGAFGAGAASTGGGGGALPCVSQQQIPQQNCGNRGNFVTSAAECDGSGSAEGSGCTQQQMAHAGNCGGPCPPLSSPPSHPSPSVPSSSNCQSIQICPPSHPSSSVGTSLCQPICAPNSAPSVAQPSTGAGGTYAHGPAHPMSNNPPPVMPPPPEPQIDDTFASGTHSNSQQQNFGSADPSSFTTQQQPQIGSHLPVQPPPPAESDNQSDRESPADVIGGGYRDTGLNRGGKEDGLSLLSSKLIEVGGGSSTTTIGGGGGQKQQTMKPTTMDWDLYEEKLPDLADYETATTTTTNIASGGASVGAKGTANAAGTTSSTVGPNTAATTFYALRTTDTHRPMTPIVWATPRGTSAERATSTTPTTITTTPLMTAPTTPWRTTTMNRVMTMQSSSMAADVQQEKNDLLSDDYSENSFKKAHASVQNRNGQKRTPFGPAALSPPSASQNVPTAAAEEDPKCSSETLRAIMQENIVLSPTISKQLIFSAGRLAFGQSIDVICSKNKFSYTVVSSKIFCEASNGPVTCFAFLQP